MKAARIFYRLVKSGAEIGADGEHLAIRTADPLTDQQRQAVRAHKTELLRLADWYADDAEIIRSLTEQAFVSAHGTAQPFHIPRPVSHADTQSQEAAREAAEERAAIAEHEADHTRQEADRIAALAEAFYNHLFGPARATGCCVAPRNRYCPEGLRLRAAYYDACAARD